MIDLLDYIRGDGRQYELQYDIDGRSGTQTLQTQREGRFFYQVKNREWERLYHDNHYIYREADISEAPDRYYILHQDEKRGSIWCRRRMELGEEFLRHPLVIHYYKSDCRERIRGHYASLIRLIDHFPAYTFQGGIVLQDVIEMGWIVGGQIEEWYLYAKDYGLVSWIGQGRGRSYICEQHSGRPDLVRDVVPCLSDPDDLFYYGPQPPPEPRLVRIRVPERVEVKVETREEPPEEPFILHYPTESRRVTQAYGANPQIYARWGLPGHEGIDLAASHGSPIEACHGGTVYRVHTNPDNNNYGIHVRVNHVFPNGKKYKTIYAHLVSASVQVGDTVARGQVIGLADNTGNSTGSHLHLTLKEVGATAAGKTNYPGDIIDPTPWLGL